MRVHVLRYQSSGYQGIESWLDTGFTGTPPTSTPVPSSTISKLRGLLVLPQ